MSRPTTSSKPSIARRVVPSTVGVPVSIVNEEPRRQRVDRVDTPLTSIGSVELLGRDIVLVNGDLLAAVDQLGLVKTIVAPAGAGPIVAATATGNSAEAVVVCHPYSDLLEIWKVKVSADASWESMGTIPLDTYPSWSAKVVSDGRENAVLIGWAHGGQGEAELFQMKAAGWVGRKAPAFASFGAASGRLFIGASSESGAPGLWSLAGVAPWTRVDRFGTSSVRILPESGLGVVSVKTEDGVVSTFDPAPGFRKVRTRTGDQSVDPDFGLSEKAATAVSRASGVAPIRSGYLRTDGTGLAATADGTFFLTRDSGVTWQTLKPSPSTENTP